MMLLRAAAADARRIVAGAGHAGRQRRQLRRSCGWRSAGSRRSRSVTVNERSPVAAWISRRLAGHVDGFGSCRRPRWSACRRTARSPALTVMPDRRSVLKPSIVTLNRVACPAGRWRTTKSPLVLVVASTSCVPRVSLISVTVAAGNDPTLGILDGAGDRSGRDLRQDRRRGGENGEGDGEHRKTPGDGHDSSSDTEKATRASRAPAHRGAGHRRGVEAQGDRSGRYALRRGLSRRRDGNVVKNPEIR